MCYFFYGTLLDHDVRGAVLGPLADGLTPQPARLQGWQRVRLTGRVYPVIVPRRGSTVEGCLVRGLPASAAARLSRFEGPEYRLARLAVATDAGDRPIARAFVSSGRAAPTPLPWHPDEWARRHKAALLRRLRGG